MPRNDFGNIDLYTPSMLPIGAAHVPCKLKCPVSSFEIPLLMGSAMQLRDVQR